MRVRELMDAGIDVCLGQDDIADAYYPFGRNNMPEVAFLAAHLLWMTARDEIEALYDMITVAPARAMNIADFGLAVGSCAHLVVHDQRDVVEVLRFHAPPRSVDRPRPPLRPDLARVRQSAVQLKRRRID